MFFVVVVFLLAEWYFVCPSLILSLSLSLAGCHCVPDNVCSDIELRARLTKRQDLGGWPRPYITLCETESGSMGFVFSRHVYCSFCATHTHTHSALPYISDACMDGDVDVHITHAHQKGGTKQNEGLRQKRSTHEKNWTKLLWKIKMDETSVPRKTGK